MTEDTTFSLPQFLPYLLNQAAEAASREFEQHYRTRYGMLRTEWRVLFHLGCYGEMTAKGVCDMASLHKTKVSRAVSALEDKRFLVRTPVPTDRRNERLSLSEQGCCVFEELKLAARDYEVRLVGDLTSAELALLRTALLKLGGMARANVRPPHQSLRIASSQKS